MSRVLIRLRAVLVAVLATLVAGTLLRFAASELVPATRLLARGAARPLLDGDFTLLLTWLAALALALAAAWGWAATLAVVVALLRAPIDAGDRAITGVPRVVHRLVLTACGAALAGGLALPAHADPGPVGAGPAQAPPGGVAGAAALSGLPLPTRATADQAATPLGDLARAAPAAATPHVVRPGESLWSIAEDHLPAGASDAEITVAWQAVHRANRAVVGADPDLIHPAQQLRLPGR